MTTDDRLRQLREQSMYERSFGDTPITVDYIEALEEELAKPVRVVLMDDSGPGGMRTYVHSDRPVEVIAFRDLEDWEVEYLDEDDDGVITFNETQAGDSEPMVETMAIVVPTVRSTEVIAQAFAQFKPSKEEK